MDEGNDQVEELTLEPAEGPRSRRPRALWAVLACVGVVAGALVVTSTGQDGTTRPGLPVALGSSTARAEGAAADSMLAWVTYVAGDELPALGGEEPAYRLSGTVTEADVRALAEVLGLQGDPVEDGPGWAVYDAGGTLDVVEGGATQWWYSSTSTMGIGRSGSSGGSAGVESCSEPSDDAATDCDVRTETTIAECTASDGPVECITGECPPDGDCALPPTTTTIVCAPGDDCVDPVPPGDPDCAVSSDDPAICPDDTGSPVDLPSEEDARAIALDLVAATGVDVDDARVLVEGPYEAWYVTVEPLLDGVPSGLVAQVTVGSGGKVTFASGHLVEPEHLGDYPVLDTRAAIDRANEQSGVATDLPVADDAPLDDVVTTVTAGDGSGPATTMPECKPQADGSEICEIVPGITCPQVAAPADEPLGAPETLECTPPLPDPGGVPEPIAGPVEIVLVDAEPSLVLLGAVDGSTDVYLVPGYRFTSEDGSVADLPAVADSELTSPPTTDTSAPAPPPVEPQPCEVLVEGDASGTTHTVQPDPTCVAPDPPVLDAGQTPAVGVGYHVDVFPTVHCNWVSVEVGDRWWWADGIATAELETWAQPTEGGILTLVDEGHATFVGDAGAMKTASLVPFEGEGDVDRPLCD